VRHPAADRKTFRPGPGSAVPAAFAG